MCVLVVCHFTIIFFFSAEALRVNVYHYRRLEVLVTQAVILVFFKIRALIGRDTRTSGICDDVKECVGFMMII